MRFHDMLWACLVAVLIAVSPAQAKQQSANRIILVLDASGSMWGQIKGTPKIDIARSAINDLLADWDPAMELGLVAYGHNNKGDCKDIEVLVPVGPNTRGNVLAAVKNLSPKGKTPLSDAVMVAADALKYTEDRATVILISDGEETCDADPCELGKRLSAEGLDFTAHVIGFDLKKEQEKGLRCLAKNTGGKYLSASDAGSLKQAFEKTVVEIKKKTKGILIKAVTDNEGTLFTGQINWYVLAAKADLAGKRKEIQKVWRGKASQPFPELAPGTYRFVAELSDARHIKTFKEIQIKDEPTQMHEIPVGFGKVKFNVALDGTDKTYGKDLAFKVVSAEADFSGKHEEIANFWRVKNGSVFMLPTGEYKILGTLPDAKYIRFDKTISVAHGSETVHKFVIKAGWVRFAARPSDQTEPFKIDLGWKIISATQDFSGNRKHLTDFWRVKSGTIFFLPAGDWLIQGTLPDYKHAKTDHTITLASGQDLPVNIIFNTAWVKFNVTLDGNPYTGKQIGWKVFRNDSGKPVVAAEGWRMKPGCITVLKQGEYTVDVLNPDLRAMKGSGNFSVKAGEQKVVEIDMKTP